MTKVMDDFVRFGDNHGHYMDESRFLIIGGGTDYTSGSKNHRYDWAAFDKEWRVISLDMLNEYSDERKILNHLDKVKLGLL